MHYFSEPEAPAPVRCRECRRWFLPGDDTCLDEHEGSGCCHYGDTAIPDPPEGTDPGCVDVADVVSRIESRIEALEQRPGGPALSPEGARALLRECAAVVAPGETLVLRLGNSWTPQQAQAMRDHLDGLGLPFLAVIVPGEELAVVRPEPPAVTVRHDFEGDLAAAVEKALPGVLRRVYGRKLPPGSRVPVK